MKLIHRTRWGALVGVGALVIATAAPLHAATLDGSTFDAGNGSLTTSLSGEVDWATPNFGVNCKDTTFSSYCRDDTPSGKNDNAFGNGTKEDTVSPTVVSGAIPPNKSDLTRFFAKVVTEQNGSDYAYLAWERKNNPSGTTNMDFELNQSKLVDGNGIPVRTDGDILMDFHLANGGTSPTIIWYRWNATAGSCEATGAPPCWGPGTTITNSGGILGNFQASVNTATGQANDAFAGTVLTTAPGPLDPFTFGEAAVNLEGAGIIQQNSCVTLNNAYVKSRSSDSFTSEIKDFILPINLGFQKCGSITIQKTSIGGTGTFNYTDTSSVAQAPNSNLTSPFSITTQVAGTAKAAPTFVNLRAGTYTFTENPTTGFDPTNLTCTVPPGGKSTYTASPDHTVANVTLVGGENVTCTYENTAQANLYVVKKTVPNPDSTGTLFNFTGNLTGSIANKGTIADPNVLPNQTYTSTESPTIGSPGPAPRWDLTTDSGCVNTVSGTAATNASIDVGKATATFNPVPGDNLTCTFVNQERGQIVVTKVDDQGNTAPSLNGAIFTLLDKSGNALTGNLADSTTCTISGATTTTAGTCSFTDVYPGTYTVRETTPPTGYSAGPDATNVVVAPGAGYDSAVPAAAVTVKDPRQFTVIVLVCRNSDHSLYPSQVTLDGSAAVTSLGAGGGGAISDASLCALQGATFSPEGTGNHTSGINIQ
ncbi:hypothetical protein GCM10012320_24610 [Sinomonas cellulolyticus]|uniref:Prealbumin-like fold domain-containing protein n=1 Tax=Sinomonas cellulolyticus TaxID=2801916 RepID=A0ABS1K0M0_9MICC|nr:MULTISPECIES: prealbumin-like fold domain-containing protein [Sinomonas]MBL0705013.1 hypothetical protein [Sinomonas cellulolyticus]GHG53766.1 hypothetical protein GCM10012320_24610 [Sinomonas sp. KCTC 49339]